jgi:hypothetical protein
MRIICIPDPQVKPGVPINHLKAAGNYICDSRPDVIVVLGDWWDMPSLSRYNSPKDVEGTRVLKDIEAGKEAMDLFLSPLFKLQRKQKKNKKRVYNPRMVFLTGNHDPMVRIPRLVEEFPTLEGFVPDDCKFWLENYGFEVIDFLKIIEIGGIRFSHYFQNMHSAKKGPLSGNIVTMMKNAGFSFVMGHQQGKKCHSFKLGDGSNRLGIVAGSFYQHEESYEGPQGGQNWNGIMVLNEVKDGGADICEVSMNYLLENWL